MINFWRSLILKIENIPLTFWQSVLLIYTASFFRTFLENYSNSANVGRIAGLIDTFFAIPIWFFTVFLTIFILLRILTKERIEIISRLLIVSSFTILIPPIIDLIVQRGYAVPYVLFTGSFSDLFKSFLTFGGAVPNATSGATLGLKIEILIGMLAVGFYVFYKTKKWWRAILGVFLFYVIIFLFASSLSLIFEIKNLATGNSQTFNAKNISNFYYLDEPINSRTNYNYRTFIVDKNNLAVTRFEDIKNQYSITLSITCLLIAVFLLGWWFWIYDKKKFWAVIKNFRPLRIIPYFFLISLGIVLGIEFSGRHPIGSLFDFLSFISLFLAFLFTGFFLVWENDQYDIEIDKITNQQRPLVKKIFSLEEWRTIKYLFLLIALNFAFLLGLYQFIFIILFLSVYHIYSAPPLRLKRFLGISSLLVAVGALIPVWMGFFLSSGTENFKVFPAKYIFGILAIVFLGENVKNLKDIEGDRKNKIHTLPVVLGEEKGKLTAGILTFFSTLLIPVIFFMNVYAFFTAVFFGVVFFFMINRKDFKEKYFLLSYAVFVFFFVIEYFLLK